MKLFLVLAAVWALASAKCGYESCNPGKDGMINVHIVSHTHDDVGWLKTVDQYYYGANQSYSNAGVQYILDSVVQELLHDSNKKFVYVEMAFFWRWWQEQDDHVRHQVQNLVRNGQLEFVGGGWCMNDEATAHYNDVIDQMTLGLRFLNDTFGECGRPRAIWQVDPFGHSREQASLLAQMDFDGLFLGRIDYDDKTQRQKTKTMEFLWKASSSLGEAAEMFTGVLPNTYSPPAGFCYDILCGDQPIIDNPRSREYNVPQKVKDFMNVVQDQAKSYDTDNLVITMGSDFQYQDANTWFKNLDKLIFYVNQEQAKGSKVNLFYSTPSCYLHTLNQANKTWSTKEDDFFPYASDPHAFWTGYFSSRPTVKGYVRRSNNVLQICKQLSSLTDQDEKAVGTLRRAQAVAQHHDAVSGTEKQHVANDYTLRLAEGVKECQDTMDAAYGKLLPLSDKAAPPQVHCNYLNISQCKIMDEDKPVAVTIFNPLARQITDIMPLPVIGSAYKVFGPKGDLVDAQVSPIADAILNIPGRKSKAVNNLFFKVDLPPVGFSTYFVKRTNNPTIMKLQRTHVFKQKGQDVRIQNGRIALVVCNKTGTLKEVLRRGERVQQMSQSFHYYKAMNGDNTRWETRASGAYIFRPNGTKPVNMAQNVSVKVLKGALVEEIHQTFSPWLSQITRLYRDTDYAFTTWVAGPIPIGDKFGKEIITRYDSKIKSDKKFYTDANGRETLQRVWDFRPTFKLNTTEPVSENYYPINSHIYIKGSDGVGNEDSQLTILTDRAQGGSSAGDGSIELMIHRRLLNDDAFGVGEPLNEPGVNGQGLVAVGNHFMLLTSPDKSPAIFKDLSERMFMAPSPSFSFYNGSEADYIKLYRTTYSGLTSPLPANVHLLTLEPWKSGTILLRLEHRFEKGEDPNLSKPVTVSLKNLFTSFDVTRARETTLGANLDRSKSQRLRWNDQQPLPELPSAQQDIGDALDVTLNPMEIKTFILSVTYKK